ncbi:SLAM family member 5 isoform X2 [Callithrix jacchus]|uniref:SLAM family member 5 isoform X3 n=1 Tax=Callithrix jacchus TaxID=9483 RepID=UPI0004F05D94|nr:SLAM family member 5 isoform X3 [Callithrix jacchus]
MAQHHVWILLLCLQTWPEAAGEDSEIFTVIGILGESVTFPVNIQEPQQVKIIAWTSETSVAVVKPGDSEIAPTVTVTHRNYYDRIHVLDPSCNLIISDLRMEDAGDYKADINTETAPYTITKHYNLQVYRRLGKPKITQSLITSVNSTCNVTLTCSVEKEENNVTYRWSPLGKEGDVLQIFRTPKDQELTYTCTAQNPVSNNSDSISAQQLCAGLKPFIQGAAERSVVPGNQSSSNPHPTTSQNEGSEDGVTLPRMVFRIHSCEHQYLVGPEHGF